MTGLDESEHQRVKELFSAAIELPPHRRDQFVGESCSTDSDADRYVADEVRSLLRHHRDETLLGAIDTTPVQTVVTSDLGHPNTDLVLADVWQANRQLLRRRLVLVAGVMTVMVTLSMLRLVTYHHAVIGYGARAIVMAVTAGCWILLWQRPALSLKQLRWIEAAIIASTGILAVVIYARLIMEATQRGDAVTLISVHNWNYFTWTVIIMIYGVLMPNTWTRAAAILLPLAIVPTVLMVTVEWFQPAATILLAQDEFGRPFPTCWVAAIVSIFAAHSMHQSRIAAVSAKQLVQYRLTRLIGSGGMANVYEAEHQLMRRPTAIKLIRPDGDDKSMQRFEREVIATAKLSHPNTIDVYDFGRTSDGIFFLAMELLPGMSLEQMVQQFGTLPPSRIIHFTEQVCGALSEAHGVGLVHRDVKPANIFAARRGGIDDFAKLLDFGVARSHDVTDLPGSATDLIAGTPDFMSPEQSLSPAIVDGRSDLYGLGVTMFYLAAARLPIRRPTPLETMIAHQNEPPMSLQSVVDSVPEDFAEIVMQCLEKDPSDRPASADELARRLGQCRDAGTWTPDDAARWWEQA